MIDIIIALTKEMSLFAVFAFLFSKSKLFRLHLLNRHSSQEYLLIYLFFATITIIGSYLGIQIDDAIANTRAIGAVTAGLLGGPLLGGLVGLTGGIHRYFMGGFTDIACAVSTTIEGLIGGIFFILATKSGLKDKRFSWHIVFLVTMSSEIVQMGIILLVAKPYEDALALVHIIAFPMIFFNAIGASIFMTILYDRKKMVDEAGAEFAKIALNIAYKTIPVLGKGLNIESATKLTEILQEETGVSAVYITDAEKLLAFKGVGDDHHLVGESITGPLTLECIRTSEVIFADGGDKTFKCTIDDNCPLGTALIVPLVVDDEVVGAIGFFEKKRVTFLSVNKLFGEGVGKILSTQLIKGKYEAQKRLLLESELKLIQAQINPHFLFNTLNTISAVTRMKPEKAKELINNLAAFLRRNLKNKNINSLLEDEIEHVKTYLNIEKERFQQRLNVEYSIDKGILQTKLPTFTLQPIVENAVKYAISNMLDGGQIIVRGYRDNDDIIIQVEDNGGFYEENILKNKDEEVAGLGMNIVSKRIRNMYGELSGLSVICEPHTKTIIQLTIHKSEKKNGN